MLRSRLASKCFASQTSVAHHIVIVRVVHSVYRSFCFNFLIRILAQVFSHDHCHITDGSYEVNVRIAHLRIAHWGAILRWAILSPSVIRIAHPNY